MTSFQSLYSHEFIRIASCVPRTQVAGVAANMAETAALARQGHEDKAALMVFPEHYNVNASVPKTSRNASWFVRRTASSPTPIGLRARMICLRNTNSCMRERRR